MLYEEMVVGSVSLPTTLPPKKKNGGRNDEPTRFDISDYTIRWEF